MIAGGVMVYRFDGKRLCIKNAQNLENISITSCCGSHTLFVNDCLAKFFS